MTATAAGASALTRLTLVEASEAVRKGEVTSVSLTQAALDAFTAADRTINASISLDREEALETAEGLDKLRKGGRTPRRAARCAACTQRYVLQVRQALHMRLEDPQVLPPDLHGDRNQPFGECRVDHDRIAQHGRVRSEPDRPQRPLRRLPQSLARGLLHRWFLIGLGCSGGCTSDLRSVGVRHRWLHPSTCDHVRYHRHQGHSDACFPLRRHAALVLCRQRRTSGANGARLRASPGPDRWPRSERSDFIDRAGTGL